MSVDDSIDDGPSGTEKAAFKKETKNNAVEPVSSPVDGCDALENTQR